MINHSATLSGRCYLDTQHQGLASELPTLDEIKITWFLDRCLIFKPHCLVGETMGSFIGDEKYHIYIYNIYFFVL